MSTPRDRATTVTTTLLEIILSSDAPRSDHLRHHVEELLRDEFSDVRREAIADRGLNDEA